MKEKISKWYTQGLWTAEMVQEAVIKGIISENEYEMIIKQR